MKLTLANIMIILAIVSVLFVPFLAGKYEVYKLKKDTYDASIQNCINGRVAYILFSNHTAQIDKNSMEYCENYYDEASKKAQENINNLPISTKIKLYLNSSKVYWYLWFIPIIFLIIAYISNIKKISNIKEK